MNKQKKGFTAVEIVIVVAVVGLLAAIGTLAVARGVENSRIKTAESELEMLANSILQMVWDTGRWPNGDWRNETGGSKVSNLAQAETGLFSANTNVTTYGEWKGPYYEEIPVDPWGNNYFFDPDYEGTVVVGSTHPGVTPVRLDD